jgi:RimJ/RimL family protein N-acetyltransferase
MTVETGEPPRLRTRRLVLRPYALADFEAFAALWADPAVTRFIGLTPRARDVSWMRFLRNIGHWQALGFGYLAIADGTTGAYLGECGFQEAMRPLAPSIEGTLEAGWVLTPEAWGRGIASEAMAAMLAWADAAFPATRQTCIIDPAHAASLRVADKLGFAAVTEAPFSGGVTRIHERWPAR